MSHITHDINDSCVTICLNRSPVNALNFEVLNELNNLVIKLENDSDIKLIILTGGSRGIGHATSKKFWDDGWTVVTFSRSEVAPQCPWSNNKQLHCQVD